MPAGPPCACANAGTDPLQLERQRTCGGEACQRSLVVSVLVSFVVTSFSTNSWPVAAWPDCQRLLPHVLAVGDHGQRLDVELVEWLWVLHQAGRVPVEPGPYRQALTLQEQALAGLRSMLGDLQGARQLLEQALAARRQVLGDDHPDTLTSMHNLAAVRRELGEL
jgi:hypothetical protein